MHSSTPDSENQTFLLSDNQTSSKVLAWVQCWLPEQEGDCYIFHDNAESEKQILVIGLFQ